MPIGTVATAAGGSGTTTWLPTAEVMRVVPEPPAAVATVPMAMEALADLAQSDQIIGTLLPMVKAYRDWITQQPRHPISDKVQNDTANSCGLRASSRWRIVVAAGLVMDPDRSD